MSRALIWFRKGLRLHDNPAFMEAIKGDIKSLFPVFVLDPEFVCQQRVGINRFGFLLESLTDLDQQLREKNSRLLVLQGKPDKVLIDFIERFKIAKLCFESDTEPYAKVRDSRIRVEAEKRNVEVVSAVSHTLYDPEMLLGLNQDNVPLSMQSFLALLEKVKEPPTPVLDLPNVFPPVSDIIEDAFRIPSLKDLGYVGEKTSFITGGETTALQIMKNYLKNAKKTLEFEKPKTNPASLEPDTTCLSAYLKFGCLSVRHFYAEIKKVYAKSGGKHSKPPVSLLGQLYWREFFYLFGYKIKNFDRITGNKLCRVIDWDYNKEYIEAWKNARTGYPWIDACMTQLRQDGWLHHLARHSVACFLTRGDLYQSWEHGAAVFDLYLIDADWSLNNGNWMWLSASAFFHQYFRVYSPITFAKKYDKDGKFIKKYLPVLKKLPSKYIYEPWNAPIDVQRRAGCVIGKDYPKPVVDHKVVSKANMDRMKAAYNRKLYGDSLTTPSSDSATLHQTGSVRSNESKTEGENDFDCGMKRKQTDDLSVRKKKKFE